MSLVTSILVTTGFAIHFLRTDVRCSNDVTTAISDHLKIENGSSPQFSLNPCESAPCFNGAQCKPMNPNATTHKCLCMQGFKGKNCQHKVSLICTPHSCPSDNHCFTDGTSIECVPRKLRGVLIPCTHNLCHNSGDCYLVRGIPRCFCTHTYHGTYCENPLQTNNALFRHSRDGGSFYIGLFSFGAAFIIVSIVLLVCNIHTWSCQIVMPRKDYNRWRDAQDQEQGIQLQSEEERSRIRSDGGSLYTVETLCATPGTSSTTTGNAFAVPNNPFSLETDFLSYENEMRHHRINKIVERLNFTLLDDFT